SSIMMHLLHPTSAVCGMPLQPALNFIKEVEGYERGLYAGFLGPVNFNNLTHLFVNLRCMQIINDQKIRLYAGAGITADSDPNKEFVETQLKMNTLKNLLFK
ncbi:MAG: isochorismate synthase, partial [Cyclobacteriaceae bacterium]